MFGSDICFTHSIGGTIHNILVIAQKQEIGAFLEALLRQQGYQVTVEESYNKNSDNVQGLADKIFNLVIVTNTSIPPAQILSIIPDIKVRHADTRILVLSGYCTEYFLSDLKQKGIDGFHSIPFEQVSFIKEVAAILSEPALRQN